MQLIILFLFPIIKNIPVPADFTTRIITWRTPSEYNGEPPDWTKTAQNQMGFLMGFAFLCSFGLSLILFL